MDYYPIIYTGINKCPKKCNKRLETMKSIKPKKNNIYTI